MRGSLVALGVRPSRRLGQNFLVDRRIAERIVAAAEPAGRTVIEIGPGLGALSESLAEKAAELFLVEVDRRMAARLEEQFTRSQTVHVLAADALEVDFASVLAGREPAVAIANLPYSVGSQILLRLMDARRHFNRLVVMLQREVAERIVAAPGSKAYGVLSLLVGLHGEARIVFRVPPSAFVPRPKVESAVVTIGLDAGPRAPVRSEVRFREVVRAAFGQRRKTLRGALSKLASADRIERAGIDPGRRGETLSLTEFAALANELDERN
ncbi:MAG: 16S rRNA (adenine(1518)-N(6)/adenine(1519)-N(6))-dimethyltransferase RsmA [Candidatus Binatia bacterium]